MSLRLLKLIGRAELVALKQPSMRSFGVPPGGPFDTYSHQLALAAAKLPSHGVSLELALGEAELQFQVDSAVAVGGASAQTFVDGALISTLAVHRIKAGSVLRFARPERGFRVYLACRPSPAWRPGTTEIRAGESIEVVQDAGWTTESIVAELPRSDLATDAPLRLIPGPQATDFDTKVLEHAAYAVDSRSDRMGLRLRGPGLFGGKERQSEPSCVGAVQVDHSGQPIILGPDGPTIGGYPKLGVVIRADLDRLGQLAPGSMVRFAWIRREEAIDLWREESQRRASVLSAFAHGLKGK